MKNIFEILTALGITIPEDKKKELEKELLENYKTSAEVKKITDKLEKVTGESTTLKETYDKAVQDYDKDLTTLKKQLEDAGTDTQKIKELQEKMEKLQGDYSTSKTEYEEKLKKQKYEFAVKDLCNGLKFTSNSAKKAFMTDALAKGLQLDGDDVLGFDQFVEKYKLEDASAFVKEEENKDEKKPEKKPPVFTTKSNGGKDGKDGAKEEQKETPRFW